MSVTAEPPVLTPMLQQYLELKKKYADSILFFRLGDFYEMFFDDATTAAPVLEVQLTSRDRNSANPVPMCGIPYHAAGNYVQKLVQRGFKVAICEQFEEPVPGKGGKPGKTIIRRDVTRVVTPALIGDPDSVSEETNNWLLAISESDGAFDLVLFDLLGGELRRGAVPALAALSDFAYRVQPRELLVTGKAKDEAWLMELKGLLPQSLVTYRDSFEKGALEAIYDYLKETQKLDLSAYWGEPKPLFSSDHMVLDATALSALEVFRSQSQGIDGPCLIRVLDKALTPMGRRTLKDWLAKPLCQLAPIHARLDAVENLVRDVGLLETLKGELSKIRDLERLTSKVIIGLAMPRDLKIISEVLAAIPRLHHALAGAKSAKLKGFSKTLAILPELASQLERALEESPPATLREGGIFKASYDPRIHELRELSLGAKSTIAAMETREQERTGISSLKIKYSRVFGYTIEVTSAHLKKVPADYTRKQTIANGERYITEELKIFEEKVISADERLRQLEESLFFELRAAVLAASQALLQNARTLGEIDALISLARVSRDRGYVRPEVHDGWDLEITNGRHPVVEGLVPAGSFVPNSLKFTEESCRTMVITGPNMAGKSTIMRQAALLSLMAHLGCFVPAEKARVPLMDAIFTRIGAADDLSRGQSTFMVEMAEMARILNKASRRSLILIDEIGRGTSTYDGLSLAWSLVEYVHTSTNAKTLFATHFHEITALEKSFPALQNWNVLVKKWENEIVFLHRLVPGVCNRSYGIEVARLAGLPPRVLSRAQEILGVLESQSQRGSKARHGALSLGSQQLTIFGDETDPENRASLES